MSNKNITALDVDFETSLKMFLKGRRKVSPAMHIFLQVLVALFTTCAMAMAASYAVQLGETPIFKGVIIATAVGIECAVVFFSAVIYPRWFLFGNQVLAGVLLPILSVFTIMSFMVSQQFAQDHVVQEMAWTYTEDLQDSASALSIGKSTDRASLQITRNRIEGMLSKLSETKGSKATAVYHYLGQLIGWRIETIVLLVRGLWSLCFVSLCIALDAYVDLRLYSKSGLIRFIKEWNEERDLLDGARDAAQDRVGARAVGRPGTPSHSVGSNGSSSSSPRYVNGQGEASSFFG